MLLPARRTGASFRDARQSISLQVFASVYCLYTVFDIFFINERFGFNPASFLISGLSMWLIWTGASYALALLALFSVIGILAVLPSSSNHLFMAMFLHAGVLIAALKGILHGGNRLQVNSVIYANIAPFGRVLLLVMYFWGTFHKLNTQFLDAGLSYATLLLHYFPFLPASFADNSALQGAAIYGTLAIEAAALVMLAFCNGKRHFAFILCVLFHLLISVNLFRNFIPFSMLTLILCTFYIHPFTIVGMRRQAFWVGVLMLRWRMIAAAVAIAVLAVAALFSKMDAGVVVGILFWIWMPVAALVLGLAIVCFLSYQHRRSWLHFVAPGLSLNVLVAVFFINCAAPYIGLKNGQSLDMFSNLITENGQSNHLIVRRPVYLFPYLDNTVNIIETSHPDLAGVLDPSIEVSWFIVQYHMARRPDEMIVYEQGGLRHSYLDGIPPDLADEWRKPVWLYKLLNFDPVVREGRAV